MARCNKTKSCVLDSFGFFGGDRWCFEMKSLIFFLIAWDKKTVFGVPLECFFPSLVALFGFAVHLACLPTHALYLRAMATLSAGASSSVYVSVPYLPPAPPEKKPQPPPAPVPD